MNQRQVLRGGGALVGALVLPGLLSGCGLDIGKFDYTEPQFVGSYAAAGSTTVVALGEDRTFTATGVPDAVLDKAVRDDTRSLPSEIEGTWKYVAKNAADHVELTVTDADGLPVRMRDLPLYVADADDLFFLPDQLGREKVVVSRRR
ncbi:hypothetical protein ACO229_25075 [Promicromonospora sp. MS192]|uniref:hypothetical protein n=1 Tax=Promicromonospora sp. MS192 TaxID=3412684 RepID=UPI003C2D7B91